MDHMIVPLYQAYVSQRGDHGSQSNGGKAQCGDLFLGLGDVAGCGRRHFTADQALGALAQHRVDPTEYGWYIDMRKIRELQTTGWGIGSERLLAWILQHDDIRNVQLFPRQRASSAFLDISDSPATHPKTYAPTTPFKPVFFS